MSIGNVWNENFYVIKANILHENLHDNKKSTSSKYKKTINSVSVYNDDYDLYGVCDCLEFTQL